MRIFFFYLFFLSSSFLFAVESVPEIDPKKEMSEVQRKIDELRNLQDKYRSQVQKNLNNAMRWQFQSENHREARRAWEDAAEQKKKIEEMDHHIETLERRKKQLLKNHA